MSKYVQDMDERAKVAGFDWEDTGGHNPVFFKRFYGATLVISMDEVVMYKEQSLGIDNILCEDFDSDKIIWMANPQSPMALAEHLSLDEAIEIRRYYERFFRGW